MRIWCACAFFLLLAACASRSGPADNDAMMLANGGLRNFVNSRDNARSPGLVDHYADFSFAYPAAWSVTPQPTDGSAQNYVRVAAPMVNGVEPFAFHVGFAGGTGNAAADRAALRDTARQLAQEFGASLRDYHVISQGPDRVGRYDSVGWRFTATAPGAPGEAPVQVFGRGDIILPPGATRGVTLVTLATSRSNEVHGVADLGASGTLRELYDSFRLLDSNGRPVNAAPRPAAPAVAAPVRSVPQVGPARRGPVPSVRARLPSPAGSPATPPAPQASAPHPSATPPAPIAPRPQQVPPPAPAPAPSARPAGNGQRS